MLALICPLVFSLSPIRQLSRPDLRQVLASQADAAPPPRCAAAASLVVAQVALAVILLTASSLAFRASATLYRRRPLASTVDRLLIFGLEFNDAMFPDAGRRARRGGGDP